MASSDEEGEILPRTVNDYRFVDPHGSPIPFSVLPLYWSDNETRDYRVDRTKLFLFGSTDGGLQQIYKEVVAWKMEVSYALPEVYVLSKGKTWIKLQKPRKSYEEFVKNVLITVHFLHFLKRNPEADRDMIWTHLTKTLSSYNVVEPTENYLLDAIIRSATVMDKDLAKSKHLRSYLIKLENPERELFHQENQTRNKSKFIVSDDDDDDDAESDDETAAIFDSVCAYCDNGGDVLPCEGRCMRSFHPTIDAGADTYCESLGFADAAQYEAIPNFLCNNCKFDQHQCFICGALGSSDKSSTTKVFPCVSATCGHFYHPNCVAPLLNPSDGALAEQIIAGESFTCPIHKCHVCEQGENKEVHELQFAVCRRCPKAYHRKCLPRIALEGSADGSIPQRAWDDLLPKRILIYCLDHKIIPRLGTPKRDHLLFPYVERRKNQEGSKIEKAMSEKRSKAFGNLAKSNLEDIPDAVEKSQCTAVFGAAAVQKGKSSTACEKKSSHRFNISISSHLGQPSTMVKSKSGDKDKERDHMCTFKPIKMRTVTTPAPVDPDREKRDPEMEKRIKKLMKDSVSSFNAEEFVKEQKRRCAREIYLPQTGLDKTMTLGKVEASVKAVRAALKKLDEGRSVEDAKAVCEPDVLNQLIIWKEDDMSDTGMTEKELNARIKARLVAKRVFTAESSNSPTVARENNKNATTSRLFLKEGVSLINLIEGKDSGPDVPFQPDTDVLSTDSGIVHPDIASKKKLAVYLAPFIHGLRYTSFGRHFTKVDKLKEIVDRLHWYVENGDTIVDFCCGSNDFSFFMKQKLDSMGKRCSFKNYDLITPKNHFNFQRRDWFTVPVEELPDGSRLVMGLNPPFGVQASLANKFINHALEFKPKLLILIVPRETKRLDKKRSPYDLIWEDDQILSGKAFYLPGTVDTHDQPLEDWNVSTPPLSLWSRPDWTSKHKGVAEKRGHIRSKDEGTEAVVSNYLMEENHDCYGDFSNIIPGYRDLSTILDDVPEELDGCQAGRAISSSYGEKPNPPPTGREGMNMTLDMVTDAKEITGGTVDMDISSPVISSTNSGPGPTSEGPQCFQPSHSGHYPAFASLQYPAVPYGSGIQYTQPSLHAFPSVGHVYPPAAMTPMNPPPSTSFGHGTYPSQPLMYGRQETDIWPPGTNPPYYRY